MSLAIGHREKDGDVIVLDALRERKPPFSPQDVTAEFSELLKSYRVSKVVGDRYAGEWPREKFREHGVVYEAGGYSRRPISIATLCRCSTAAGSICSTIRVC